MLKKYNLSSKLEKMICIGSELIGNTSCILLIYLLMSVQIGLAKCVILTLALCFSFQSVFPVKCYT